eukprot:4675840-Prymnesium_polylepis.1
MAERSSKLPQSGYFRSVQPLRRTRAGLTVSGRGPTRVEREVRMAGACPSLGARGALHAHNLEQHRVERLLCDPARAVDDQLERGHGAVGGDEDHARNIVLRVDTRREALPAQVSRPLQRHAFAHAARLVERVHPAR